MAQGDYISRIEDAMESKASVLLLDDDANLTSAFKTLLEAQGFATSVADDGVEG